MINREEIINNPGSWITTEKLNLDFFDFVFENGGGSYYLKKKDSESIYYGHYCPSSKSFECYKLHNHQNKITLKRENVTSFVSLPPLHYKRV